MHIIFDIVVKILLANIKQKFMAPLASYHLTSSRQEVNKILRLSRFFEYISGCFHYLFMIFLVARSYRALAVDIKSLIASALVTLALSFKVQIFALFDDFWHFIS